MTKEQARRDVAAETENWKRVHELEARRRETSDRPGMSLVDLVKKISEYGAGYDY